MKKALLTLMCLATMMAAGMGLKAQEVTITLKPGWTWIGIPNTDTLDFATAFGSFTPAEGDMIRSQYAYTEYDEGEWFGGLKMFYPGYGYLYYSNRTEPVTLTFNVQQPTPQVVVTTAEPTNITTNRAMVGGTVTIEEGNHIFARGVCWGTEPNPDIDGNQMVGDAIAGSQSSTLYGLTPSTSYYVRAYVVTNYGLVYGNQQSFITESAGSGGEHEYVDLGLPSGALWATCNVGADVPEDYGDYFAWGETQPKNEYSWSTYQYCNGSENTLTKYCHDDSYGYNGFTDNLTTLLPEDDAATANWGENWRMPIEEEWVELIENTTSEWTTRNGIYGMLFIAGNGNTLFLPGAFLPGAGGVCMYWSSLLDMDNPRRARAADFEDMHYEVFSGRRFLGYSVRPIYATSRIINATANPVEGGEVSGAGTYQEGRECTLTATPNEGYTFTNWTENGEVVSIDAIYTFTVNADRSLVANFSSNAPTGAINGKFTINENGNQVYFSQGNLQYQASTKTWKFAENQYDYVGDDNSNISSTYSGWIDLFGWGTSGWNSGNTYYHPWDSDYSDGSLYGPLGTYNLTDSYANTDWGVYNPISNGGNTANVWRTLTLPEWKYVFHSRSTTSGIRYAKANVNNVNGVILLPDDWSTSTYSLSDTNDPNASFSSNMLTASQWSALEQAGAVFLPAAGRRYGPVGFYDGSEGYYWSASCNGSYSAYYAFFYDSSLFWFSDPYDFRYQGLSVRLVYPAEN